MDTGLKPSKSMRGLLGILLFVAYWEPSVSLAQAPISRTLQVATYGSGLM